LRLDRAFRYALYAAFLVLFVTGAGWLLADRMKDAASGEAWQTAAADLLMAHGGAAMAILLLLGALVPLHVRPGWRMRKNRTTGTLMVTANGAFILTGFALYYAGVDVARAWASWIHTAIGLVFPILLLIHITIGRRWRNRK
jgi:hypothetical protein